MNTKDAIKTFITDKTEVNSVTNNKVGQLITETLMHTRTLGLELEIRSKGFNEDDVRNESFDIEPGDIVYGWLNPNVYINDAMFMGGDPTDKDNYTQGSTTDYTDVRPNVVYP